MTRFLLTLPSMYGDHHVTEVRHILASIEGIGEIYASSSFHFIDLEYDPSRTSPDAIKAAMQQAGYLEELDVPVETQARPASPDDDQPFFRHTAAFPNIQKSVSFTQEIPASSRPLWPCPGFSVNQPEKEVENGQKNQDS